MINFIVTRHKCHTKIKVYPSKKIRRSNEPKKNMKTFSFPMREPDFEKIFVVDFEFLILGYPVKKFYEKGHV